jgi:hypothetical protein
MVFSQRIGHKTMPMVDETTMVVSGPILVTTGVRRKER